MRRFLLAFALVLFLLPSVAEAEVLVLRDGRVFKTAAPPRYEGELVHFTWNGTPVTLRRAEVDETKTAELNRVLASGAQGRSLLQAMERVARRPSSTRPRPAAIVNTPPQPPEVEELSEDRLPAFMPEGDYPLSVQPDRVEREPMGTAAAVDITEGREPERELTKQEQERQAAREAKRAEREARRAERAAEREANRAERTKAKAEAELEREMEEAKGAEEEPAKAASTGSGSGSDSRAQAIQARIERIDKAVAEERETLKSLTDLKKKAEAETSGEVRSLDDDIERSLRRLEQLEERRKKLEQRLADMQ